MRSAQEQLADIKARATFRYANGLPPSPSAWDGDGVDHINIASGAATELGRALCLRRNQRFLHPVLGSFTGLNNLWFFLLAENPADNLRTITEHTKLNDFVKKNGGERRFVENFRAIVVQSIWIMVMNHKNLISLMLAKESQLPFDCYRRVSAQALPERFKFTSWYVEGVTEVQKAIKERRVPDLTFLLDKKTRKTKDAYIYSDVLQHITGTSPDKQIKVDLGAWNAACWADYDGVPVVSKTKETRKKDEAKRFTVVPIDPEENVAATPEQEAAPITAEELPDIQTNDGEYTPALTDAEVSEEIRGLLCNCDDETFDQEGFIPFVEDTLPSTDVNESDVAAQ